jgi:hypothetical protein
VGVLALLWRLDPVDPAELLPNGWPQLNAVFEHGFAYARSLAFYDTTLVWECLSRW